MADWVTAIAWSEPDWAVATTAVATAVTALVLAITAIAVGRQLRDARRTRHGQLLTDLSRRWEEPVIIKSQRLFSAHGSEGIVKLVAKVYEQGGATDAEVEEYTVLESLPNLWELLGVLHSDRAISLSVIDRMWGAAIINAWDEWEAPIGRLRKATDNFSSYVNFQDLADDLREYRRRFPNEAARPDPPAEEAGGGQDAQEDLGATV